MVNSLILILTAIRVNEEATKLSHETTCREMNDETTYTSQTQDWSKFIDPYLKIGDQFCDW